MPKDRIATQAHDFTALPLRLPALPAFPTGTTHYLYLRANAPKVPTEETPREIFAVNVPVDATKVHIRSLFADQLGGGRVEAVDYEDAKTVKGITAPAVRHGKKRKRSYEEGAEGSGEEVGLLPGTWDRELHRSGGTAVIRFVDRQSAELALREARRAVKAGKEIPWGAGIAGKVPPLGSARYQTHHKLRYPDPSILQTSVDTFMAAFSEQEAERERQLKRQRSEPDEDGFITVTRGGRNAPAREEATKAKEEELKKREKNRVKDDFYRFQTREKKKEAAKELVRGFEEDRRKVEEMRKRRGRIRPE